MASLALTMSCFVLSSPSPRPPLLGTAPKPSSFLRPLSTKTPSQAQLLALKPSSSNSMASLALTMSCSVLSSPIPRPLLLGTAPKPSSFLRPLSTKTPFPSFLANLPPLSPKKLHFPTKATLEDSDSEKSGNVSEEEGELPKEEESSELWKAGELPEESSEESRRLDILSDAERGERLLKRLSIRFIVANFANRWDTAEFAELSTEILKVKWAQGLEEVEGLAELFERGGEKHWITAYLPEGSARVFYEVQSNNEFVRRKLAILSLALNGLTLMELQCFPIFKFLDLLSVHSEEERLGFEALFFEMIERAKNIFR